MLKFNDGKLTTQGKALLAKVQDGQGNINFTRVVVGNGTYTSDESTEQRKALKSQKQEFTINSKRIVNDSTVVLSVIISNYKSATDYLKNGYDITEIGVYARDTSTNSEILYSIATAATSDYMPAYDGIAPSVVNLSYSLEVANASNVTFNTNGALASAKDVEALFTSLVETDVVARSARETALFNNIYIRQSLDQLQGEKIRVTLTNSQQYPFNDSAKTVKLSKVRTNTNYIVSTEVISATGGGVGDIRITGRLLNGFTISYSGAAKSVTLDCWVQGGY